MPWVELQKSGKYRAMYRLPDGRRRSAGTFVHKKKAQSAAAVAEAEAASTGWRDPSASQRTWGEWCETWWRTRGVEPGTLKRDASSRDATLIPKWGNVPLDEITRFDVKEWAADLLEEGMSPATVQKRVYLLSASLVSAIDKEIIATNPAFRIPIAKGETDDRRYLTHDEADAILSAPMSPLDLSVIQTLLGTGLRWGEVVGLQVGRVDFKRGVIQVAEVWDREAARLKAYPKSGHRRDVPIRPYLAPLLQEQIGDRAEGHVFLRNGYRLQYSNWRKSVWLPALEHAKLKEVRIHDLRHTFASWLLQDPVAPLTLAEVGQLLGHASSQTTQIYAKLASEVSPRVRAAMTSPAAWQPRGKPVLAGAGASGN